MRQKSEKTHTSGLFGDDFAIDIVAGFNRVPDGTATELLSVVFSGSGGPVAITTVVASLWRHITTITASSQWIALPLPCAWLLYQNNAKCGINQYYHPQ